MGLRARCGIAVAAAGLLLLSSCTETPSAEPPNESQVQSGLIQNPTLGGPYGSLVTYKCTSRPTSYCYNPLGSGDATSSEIDVRMNNAATNWGCGGRVPDGGNVTSGRYAGSREWWYLTQNGYWYGCLVIWNVEKQAAYVMFQGDTSHANNVGTSTKIIDRYSEIGFRDGVLGYPISNPTPFSADGTTYQQFANGVITYRNGAPYAYFMGGTATAEQALVTRWKQTFNVSPTSGPAAQGLTQDSEDLATNFALQANGGIALASSTYSGYSLNAINDGKREANYSNTSTYWNNANLPPQYSCWYANGAYPWVKVALSGSPTINRIDVFSLADGPQGAIPTTGTTSNNAGLAHFHVQYCPAGTTCTDGASGVGWVEPPGGYITYNNKARRTVQFADVSASAVRVWVECASNTWARVAELEAWGGKVGRVATYWDSYWGYKGYVTAKDGAPDAQIANGPIAARWDAQYNRVNTLGGVPALAELGVPIGSLETVTKNLTTGLPFQAQRFEGGIITWRPSNEGYYDGVCNGSYSFYCPYLNGGVSGTRYDQYYSTAFITSALPTCASLVPSATAYKPWELCRDADGNISDVVTATAGTSFYGHCATTCLSGTYWSTHCNDPSGSPSTCGLYGIYAASCEARCNPGVGIPSCTEPCTSPKGQSTTCGAQYMCSNPADYGFTTPPLCSDRCTTSTSCSVACRSSTAVSTSDTNCGRFTGSNCKSTADFIQTTTGPRFRFTLSSPLASGPDCFGDSDNDCLEDAMENQLAALAAPRITYDEQEACGGGLGVTDFGSFYGGLNDAVGADTAAKMKHCGRVDFFQVRPETNDPGDPRVTVWTATDGKPKTVLIRYLMAYPFQKGGDAASASGHPGHYGDLEWIQLRATGTDMRTWVIDKIWLSHHGPVHTNYSSSRSYAEHMARIARDSLTESEAVLTINADEDSHGSWSGETGSSTHCEGGNDTFYRDCMVTSSMKNDIDTDRFSWFHIGANNLGGSKSPEQLVPGRFSDWGNGRATVYVQHNWQGPGGTGTQDWFYVQYDSGHSLQKESLIDTADLTAGSDAKAHERYAGWKCAARDANGDCATDVEGAGFRFADGNCYWLDSNGTEVSIADGMSFDLNTGRPRGYCYTLWGAQARDNFTK